MVSITLLEVHLEDSSFDAEAFRRGSGDRTSDQDTGGLPVGRILLAVGLLALVVLGGKRLSGRDVEEVVEIET